MKAIMSEKLKEILRDPKAKKDLDTAIEKLSDRQRKGEAKADDGESFIFKDKKHFIRFVHKDILKD